MKSTVEANNTTKTQYIKMWTDIKTCVRIQGRFQQFK